MSAFAVPVGTFRGQRSPAQRDSVDNAVIGVAASATGGSSIVSERLEPGAFASRAPEWRYKVLAKKIPKINHPESRLWTTQVHTKKMAELLPASLTVCTDPELTAEKMWWKTKYLPAVDPTALFADAENIARFTLEKPATEREAERIKELASRCEEVIRKAACEDGTAKTFFSTSGIMHVDVGRTGLVLPAQAVGEINFAICAPMRSPMPHSDRSMVMKLYKPVSAMGRSFLFEILCEARTDLSEYVCSGSTDLPLDKMIIQGRIYSKRLLEICEHHFVDFGCAYPWLWCDAAKLFAWDMELDVCKLGRIFKYMTEQVAMKHREPVQLAADEAIGAVELSRVSRELGSCRAWRTEKAEQRIDDFFRVFLEAHVMNFEDDCILRKSEYELQESTIDVAFVGGMGTEGQATLWLPHLRGKIESAMMKMAMREVKVRGFDPFGRLPPRDARNAEEQHDWDAEAAAGCRSEASMALDRAESLSHAFARLHRIISTRKDWIDRMDEYTPEQYAKSLFTSQALLFRIENVAYREILHYARGQLKNSGVDVCLIGHKNMWNRLPTQFPEREFKEVESSDDEAGDRPQRPWAPPPPRPASANAHFDAVVSHVLSMGKIVISYGKWFDSEPLAPQVTPAKRSRSEAEAETESPNSQAVSAILAASKAVGSNDEVLDVLMAAGRLAPISEHAEDAEMGALVPLNDEELSQASQASQQSQTERPREPTPEDQVPESDEETGTTTPRSSRVPAAPPAVYKDSARKTYEMSDFWQLSGIDTINAGMALDDVDYDKVDREMAIKMALVTTKKIGYEMALFYSGRFPLAFGPRIIRAANHIILYSQTPDRKHNAFRETCFDASNKDQPDTINGFKIFVDRYGGSPRWSLHGSIQELASGVNVISEAAHRLENADVKDFFLRRAAELEKAVKRLAPLTTNTVQFLPIVTGPPAGSFVTRARSLPAGSPSVDSPVAGPSGTAEGDALQPAASGYTELPSQVTNSQPFDNC